MLGRRGRKLRRLALRALGHTLAAGGILFIVSLVIFDPPLRESKAYPAGAILRDRTGEILRVELSPDDQDCRPFYAADANDWVVKALVASEDKRFWSHNGIDFLSLARAIWQNLSSGRRISGASTITSQSVRLIVPHPRVMRWKYVETFQALRIEFVMTKREIIEQYLNRAPLGSNLIGIEAGSMGWFGKTAKSLSIGEAALLIGMVQSPSRFRPDRHLDAALKRRAYVLERMTTLGMITAEQKEGAESAALVIRRAPRPFSEPFFADWAKSTLPRASGDFTTTLDPTVQNSLSTHIRRQANELGCSVAGVVIEVKTGAVRALTCSDDYFSGEAGQVNTALAPRPAGSTLKPFIMASAMDMGFVTPSKILADVPRHFGSFSPINFSGGFRGKVSASDALILSLNIPFIDMVTQVGIRQFNTTLQALGLNTISPSARIHGAGIAVGNADVRLIDLANAYAAIARGGVMTPPRAIENDEGKAEGCRVFSEGSCWMISDILSQGERSQNAIGHVADARLPRVAWKTGTSSAFRDAWTVAWNPEYVVAVWCGYKSGNFGDQAIVGSSAAAPVAWSVFRDFYPAGLSPWYSKPQEIVERQVCRASGQPASAICPEITTGFAIRGKSSPSVCTVHRTDLDGRLVESWPDDVAAFLGQRKLNSEPEPPVIAEPADQSVYRIIPGIASQAIAAHAGKVAESEALWWFLDEVPIGTTRGGNTLVIELPAKGIHRLTCATAEGRSASVAFTIE